MIPAANIGPSLCLLLVASRSGWGRRRQKSRRTQGRSASAPAILARPRVPAGRTSSCCAGVNLAQTTVSSIDGSALACRTKLNITARHAIAHNAAGVFATGDYHSLSRSRYFQGQK